MTGGFPKAGIHLDLRIQVPPIRTLHRIARQVAGLGFNVLLIEWEGSYPFRDHPVLPNKFAYSREEIRSFLESCSALGLEVIPLQQCFGHLEYVLRHERYAHLRESEKDLCQLCPCRGAAALAVFQTIFADLAEMHTSPIFHIGGDETYLLGSCPECRRRVRRDGKSQLYVGYFKAIADHLLRLGKRPMVWADMLLKYPEAAAEMPPGTIFMDWNYGAAPKVTVALRKIRKAKFEIWGAAAMRSAPDNHSFHSWRKHFENLRHFPPFARRNGYAGIVLTSWSTSGLYGYQWEAGGEVQNLYAIRRVYPFGGFSILLSAFHDALREDRAFEPSRFVEEYAMEYFGVPRRRAGYLWAALSQDEPPVKGGADIAIIKAARASKTKLAKLRPTRHLGDFQHIELIQDLRDHHVRFKAVERRIQSEWMTEKRLPSVLRQLRLLLAEAKDLGRRFARLNTRDLHPLELAEEDDYRFAKLRALHSRLSRSSR